MCVKLSVLAMALIIVGTINGAKADPIADAQLLAAENIRKQLPMRIDEQTTLVAVTAAGRMAKYLYRLDLEKGILPPIWYKRQKELLTNNVCRHPKMSNAMKRGASYSYMYLDSHGKLVTDIVVRFSDC